MEIIWLLRSPLIRWINMIALICLISGCFLVQYENSKTSEMGLIKKIQNIQDSKLNRATISDVSIMGILKEVSNIKTEKPDKFFEKLYLTRESANFYFDLTTPSSMVYLRSDFKQNGMELIRLFQRNKEMRGWITNLIKLEPGVIRNREFESILIDVLKTDTSIEAIGICPLIESMKIVELLIELASNGSGFDFSARQALIKSFLIGDGWGNQEWKSWWNDNRVKSYSELRSKGVAEMLLVGNSALDSDYGYWVKFYDYCKLIEGLIGMNFEISLEMSNKDEDITIKIPISKVRDGEYYRKMLKNFNRVWNTYDYSNKTKREWCLISIKQALMVLKSAQNSPNNFSNSALRVLALNIDSTFLKNLIILKDGEFTLTGGDVLNLKEKINLIVSEISNNISGLSWDEVTNRYVGRK